MSKDNDNRQWTTKLDRMSCGNCGNKEFRVYGDGSEVADNIVIVCTECNSDTILSVQRPKIMLEWGDGDGKLCVFPDENDMVALKHIGDDHES